MYTYRLIDYSEINSLRTFIDRSDITGDKEKFGWSFFLQSLIEKKEDVVVSAEFDGPDIISASGCYSIAAAWNRPRNVIPYWVIGLTRSLNSPTSIGNRLDKLETPACAYFEELGFTSLYMSRLVSKRVTYSNCQEYMDNLVARLGTTRYDCKVEKLVDKLSKYNDLSNFYKLFAHDNWPEHKQLAIMRYDLKYSERK
jgi:hypothetical protein